MQKKKCAPEVCYTKPKVNIILSGEIWKTLHPFKYRCWAPPQTYRIRHSTWADSELVLWATPLGDADELAAQSQNGSQSSTKEGFSNN